MNRPAAGPDPDRWAEVVSSAEDMVRRDASAAPGPSRPLPGQKALTLLAGLAMALSVAVATPRLAPTEPRSLPPREQASDLRAEVAILVGHIEAYRAERGELPPPSMLGPFLDEGYEYRILDREAGRFEVRRSAGGVTVAYDGELPLGLWLTIGGATEDDEP